MCLHATIPATLFEFFSCLLTVFFLAFLTSVVSIEQGTGRRNFEEDHLTWVAAVKVDGGINEGVVEG